SPEPCSMQPFPSASGHLAPGEHDALTGHALGAGPAEPEGGVADFSRRDEAPLRIGGSQGGQRFCLTAAGLGPDVAHRLPHDVGVGISWTYSVHRYVACRIFQL